MHPVVHCAPATGRPRADERNFPARASPLPWGRIPRFDRSGALAALRGLRALEGCACMRPRLPGAGPQYTAGEIPASPPSERRQRTRDDDSFVPENRLRVLYRGPVHRGQARPVAPGSHRGEHLRRTQERARQDRRGACAGEVCVPARRQSHRGGSVMVTTRSRPSGVTVCSAPLGQAMRTTREPASVPSPKWSGVNEDEA